MGVSVGVYLVDLGCGGGDIFLKVVKWFEKQNLVLKLIGIDVNFYILVFVCENMLMYLEISYIEGDFFIKDFDWLFY